ncbi:MAG: hypothetical protein ACREAC_28080, partial [Blastocatellia bacterium]
MSSLAQAEKQREVPAVSSLGTLAREYKPSLRRRPSPGYRRKGARKSLRGEISVWAGERAPSHEYLLKLHDVYYDEAGMHSLMSPSAEASRSLESESLQLGPETTTPSSSAIGIRLAVSLKEGVPLQKLLLLC